MGTRHYSSIGVVNRFHDLVPDGDVLLTLFDRCGGGEISFAHAHPLIDDLLRIKTDIWLSSKRLLSSSFTNRELEKMQGRR